MRGRSEAVIMTLLGVSKTYGKAYCFPGQKRILSLMDEYQGFEISRRTLCRDLLGLEKDGFIRRTRRLRRSPAGKLLFNSTLYRFTGKAFKYVFGLGKWVKGVLSAFRVPKLSHNKSQTENEISSRLARDVEILWKPGLKGRASPLNDLLEPLRGTR